MKKFNWKILKEWKTWEARTIYYIIFYILAVLMFAILGFFKHPLYFIGAIMFGVLAPIVYWIRTKGREILKQKLKNKENKAA